MSKEEYSTLNYIAHCRHGELGFNTATCGQCSDVRWYASSCGNRHCPMCLGPRQAQWSEQVCERLPDCPHFHTVFTVAGSCREFFALNYELAAGILFAAASETLKKFQANNWGVTGGSLAVLHTWGSALNWHPHLHVLVTAGGREINTGNWKAARASYQFPVRQMSKVFGAIFIHKLEELDGAPEVNWPEDLASVEARRDWRLVLARQAWVIFNRPTLGNTRAVVRYLARYTSRIAMSNGRVTEVDEHNRTVTFTCKDYRKGGQPEERQMTGVKFIRAFTRHLVPKRFRRIRYYGWLSGPKDKVRSIPKAPQQAIGEKVVAKPPPPCEQCGANHWRYSLFYVRPFDVNVSGSEVKSFSLGWEKRGPPERQEGS